ncbi:uncharacterized protein LOC142589051 isoform X2 [Dermacentor variabilis]|uniref:uncharacterized protein LOC142589051 isoform X2 n=1 Tax=Dermacentor variabilis TaxID=34621 RepID=UPI003F5B7891
MGEVAGVFRVTARRTFYKSHFSAPRSDRIKARGYRHPSTEPGIEAVSSDRYKRCRKMRTPFITALMLVSVGMARAVPSPYLQTGDCNFSGLDLDAMVNDIIGRVPKEYSIKSPNSGDVVPGLSLGAVVFKGMDMLRPYGAALGYCRNGTRLVQVDLANTDGVLEATVPWKTCGGQKGTIETYSGARVTVIFEVVDPHGEEAKSNGGAARLAHHSGPIPVHLDDAFVSLNGAGEFLGIAVAVLTKLFPQLPKEFWNDTVSYTLRDILKEASNRA